MQNRTNSAGPDRTVDIAIIGAGAIGLAIAHAIRTMDSNSRVVVIERDLSYALASTPRASGGVRRLFALPENIELSNHSIPVYQNFNRLMAVNGEEAEIGFKKNGYLFIVPPRDTPVLAQNFERQARHGVNVEWLEPSQIKERFPSMRVDDLGAAVQSHDDGWLDPYAVLMAYRKKVKSLEVELIDDEVMAIECEGGLARAIELKSGTKLKPDNIVNAAGAWASQISAMVGMNVPITPLRRYEHFFECEARIEPLPYLKDVNRLAFRPEGKGYTGGVPTLLEPRGYNFEVDHNYFDEVVWPALAHRFPQFEKTKCRTTMPGLYDQNDFDGNPIIGPWEGECENFYIAAGFSGHGLMHAPACGVAIAERILKGRFETIDLSRLGWSRVPKGRPVPEQGII
jgi:FAD-dependent oxidoreductase domain-containing protein 1